MGKGSSGIGKGRGAVAPRASTNPGEMPEEKKPEKTLYRKSQVEEFTADYTPEMFLGDTSTWTGTSNDAKNMAIENMPKTLEIGGYTFQSMGDPTVHFVMDGALKNNTVVMMDYQCGEKIGNEYPVLQVGVRIRKYRGKIQTEIIRDGYMYKTRFW